MGGLGWQEVDRLGRKEGGKEGEMEDLVEEFFNRIRDPEEVGLRY